MIVSSEIFQSPPAAMPSGNVGETRFRKIGARIGNWQPEFLTFVVCATVLLSPVPLASNHPILWLSWTFVLGFIATVVNQTRPDMKIPAHSKSIFILSFFTIGFALFQSVPLPLLQGGISISLPSGVVRFPSLSIAPGATVVACLRFCSYLIFFWAALLTAQKTERAIKVGNLIFYGIAFHAFLALIGLKLLGDINLFAEKQAFMGMATGPFVNKNSFATFLGMGAILGIALLRNQGGVNQNWLSYFAIMGALIIIVVTLLMTQSRMGALATTIAAVTIFAQGKLPLRGWIIVLTSITSMGILAAGFGLLDRFSDVPNSAISRLELYKQLGSMIWDRPLTGFGFDSFPLAYELYHAPPVTADRVWDMGHSSYLTLWIEAGVLVGSVPIIAGSMLARRLWQHSGQSQPGRTMAQAGLGALLLCALHSLVDFSLEIQANTFLLLALIALGLGNGPNKRIANHG